MSDGESLHMSLHNINYFLKQIMRIEYERGYSNYRENKKFPKKFRSKLNSSSFIQRADQCISCMSIKASLHCRCEAMVCLIPNSITMKLEGVIVNSKKKVYLEMTWQIVSIAF